MRSRRNWTLEWSLYGGIISNAGVGSLVESLDLSAGGRSNTFLILTTNGGTADAAYRIARLLQIVSKKFYLCVPRRCKSAGTLIALGANEIVMNPLAELGPLDVQLVQRDEIGQRRSGLVVGTALEGLAEQTLMTYEKIMLQITFGSKQAISFDVASRIAANMTTGIMSPIYAQIKPDDLGKDLRDLQIATAYGERLIKYGGNAESKAVRRLVEGYPSHSFIIDADEAGTLFRTVSDQSNEVTTLTTALESEQLDPGKSPCYVARLDTKEVRSERKGRGREKRDPNAELDVARNGAGKENQGGSRDGGTAVATPEAKSKSA